LSDFNRGLNALPACGPSRSSCSSSGCSAWSAPTPWAGSSTSCWWWP